jgi:cytochrome c peroxidase
MRARVGRRLKRTLLLDRLGHLDPAKASPEEIRGEKVFSGKGQCATCHPTPFYLDNEMHDLRVEEFVAESPAGAIKTFTLRGIKESPPYLHDGRCLTLEDTVEFFNLVLGVKLTKEEKSDLVAFMRQL